MIIEYLDAGLMFNREQDCARYRAGEVLQVHLVREDGLEMWLQVDSRYGGDDYNIGLGPKPRFGVGLSYDEALEYLRTYDSKLAIDLMESGWFHPYPYTRQLMRLRLSGGG